MTKATKSATDRIGHPRRSAEAYATLAGRLTPRDTWILRMLHEHRVFTTPQLADLAWGSPITAAHRLLTLRRLGVITRWRPWSNARSTPWHWALDALGADIVAARNGVTVAELGYRRDLAQAIFGSAKLAHQIGVNGVFAALARATRARPAGDGLTEWWPEARCGKAWGHIVRPDGYGRWRQDGRVVDFFIEYDTGTETLNRVAAKIDRYAELARVTGIITPVLIWFPTPRRQANFTRLRPPIPQVPVATTNPEHASTDGEGPAGRVWAERGGGTSLRVRLIDLATATLNPADPSLDQVRAEEPEPSAWSIRPNQDTAS
jgi:hypothetical protein